MEQHNPIFLVWPGEIVGLGAWGVGGGCERGFPIPFAYLDVLLATALGRGDPRGGAGLRVKVEKVCEREGGY